MSLSAPFAPALNRGLNSAFLPPLERQTFTNLLRTLVREPALDSHASPPLCLLISVPRNDLIHDAYIMAHSPSPRQDGLSLVTFPDLLQRNVSPNLDRPAMAILRSSYKAGKTKPHAKPFKELVSQIDQRTRLALPR